MRKKTTEEFISQAKKVHGDKYDYSKVEYKNNNTKVVIICPEHGDFEVLPRTHSKGTRCQQCCFDSYKHNKKSFIEFSNIKHNGKYDYSKTNYENSKSIVTIICPEHGVFEQKAKSHLRGIGCSKCSSLKFKTEKVIKQFIKIHSELYNYSQVNYNSNHEKIKIICSIHGEFMQSPHNHKKGKGCPKCKESSGEKKVREFLEENNIKFIPQKTFKHCKYKCKLRFDFYIPLLNLCVEFNGRQHYEPVSFFGVEEGFKLTRKRDQLKINFCENNEIQLLTIKYNEDVNEVLTSQIL